MLTIRKATSADAAGLLAVRSSVSENAISPGRLEELGINAGSIIEMLSSTHTGYCALDEGEVVGFAMGDLDGGSVFALFVRPEYEGQGLGCRLMEVTVADLWRAGHGELTLSTDPGTRASRFYARQGWHYSGSNEIGESKFVLRK